MKNMIIEKKHRLNKKLYTGFVRATFTLCVRDRKKLFIEKIVVDEFLKIFKKVVSNYNVLNWVYIFMPEHFHTVIEGRTKETNILKAIVMFKQKTGYWLVKNKFDTKWQKDFYDHIHRKDEDLIKHIKYILDNPVRRGLVKNWYEYPFKGALDFDLNGLVK